MLEESSQIEFDIELGVVTLHVKLSSAMPASHISSSLCPICSMSTQLPAVVLEKAAGGDLSLLTPAAHVGNQA